MQEIAAFQTYLENRGRSQCTIRGYVRDLRLFSRWFERLNREKPSPDALTAIDIRLYRQHLQREKARPATINRRLSALRAFGAMLLDRGMIQDNPAGQVRGVGQQKAAPKWLDKRQQAALIRQVERQANNARTEPARRQASRDRAAALLLLNTGLRVSELCDLDLGDVEINERSGWVRVRSGKGSKERSIPLNNTARAALRAWLEIRGEGQGRLLVGKRGDDLTANALQRRLRSIGAGARVEASPHTLRHTFAKNLVDAGVSLEKVAMLLGHEDLNTTRIYVLPGETDLEDAVNLLDL